MSKYTFKQQLCGDFMVKTLTIKNSVYEELAGLKGREESFSGLFERLAEKENSSKVSLEHLRKAFEVIDSIPAKKNRSRARIHRGEAQLQLAKLYSRPSSDT